LSNDPCRICGGDGRIGNSFGGSDTRCPGCMGTGRRSEETPLFHDVTKTKASHHAPTNKAKVAPKQTWPATLVGDKLAGEVRDSASLSEDTKARLVREIIEHEGSHGNCTQTFTKKIRKQLRGG